MSTGSRMNGRSQKPLLTLVLRACVPCFTSVSWVFVVVLKARCSTSELSCCTGANVPLVNRVRACIFSMLVLAITVEPELFRSIEPSARLMGAPSCVPTASIDKRHAVPLSWDSICFLSWSSISSLMRTISPW